MSRSLSPSEKAWLGLGAYVLAADVFLWRRECDTLSVQFNQWLLCKQGRRLCTLVTAGTVIHLFCGMPLPFQTQLKKYLGGRND